MFGPPDPSESATLQGGNARRRGPFGKRIWVNVTVRGLEFVHNAVDSGCAGRCQLYRRDVSGGRGGDDSTSGDRTGNGLI